MFNKVFSPRISEANGVGHVGHHAIPIWLEEGLIEIIRLFDPDLKAEKFYIVLTHLYIHYVQQMRLGEDVEITTGVKKIGNTSLILEQKIYQGGRLCIKAKSTYVNLSMKSHKAVTFDPSFLQALQEHMIEDEAGSAEDSHLTASASDGH